MADLLRNRRRGASGQSDATGSVIALHAPDRSDVFPARRPSPSFLRLAPLEQTRTRGRCRTAGGHARARNRRTLHTFHIALDHVGQRARRFLADRSPAMALAGTTRTLAQTDRALHHACSADTASPERYLAQFPT